MEIIPGGLNVACSRARKAGVAVQQDSDFIGEWFDLREKAFGARSEFMLGRVTEHASEPEWYRFEHRHFDGIGAFLTLLERQGMVIYGYPSLEGSRIPGRMAEVWIRLRSALLNHRLDRKHCYYRWKVFHENEGHVPCGAAWFLLSQQETAKLRKTVREKGVSISTFLLWTLSRSIPKELLQDPNDPLLWQLPVNLRGPYLLRNVRSNHVASLFLEVPADLSLRALHRRIQGMMKKNLHWAGFLKLQAAKRQGLLKEETIAQTKGLNVSGAPSGRYIAGTFTNLGAWPGPYVHFRDESTDDTHGWLFNPPSGSGRPIGAGCVCWNDRLSLTVNFAASLVPSAQEIQRLTSVWLREIMGYLGQATDHKGSGDPESRVHYNDRSVVMAGTKIMPAGSSD